MVSVNIFAYTTFSWLCSFEEELINNLKPQFLTLSLKFITCCIHLHSYIGGLMQCLPLGSKTREEEVDDKLYIHRFKMKNIIHHVCTWASRKWMPLSWFREKIPCVCHSKLMLASAQRGNTHIWAFMSYQPDLQAEALEAVAFKGYKNITKTLQINSLEVKIKDRKPH